MTTHDLVSAARYARSLSPTDSAADVAGTGSSPEPHGTGPVATPEPDGSPSATETDAGGAARLPAAPASTYTTDEFDDLLSTVWGDLEADQRRFDDLLADALGFIGGLALNPHLGSVTARATEHLRAAEQRALWGPNHEQEDHR